MDLGVQGSSHDGLMFRTSKDKMDTVYEYLFIYFKIEDDGELNKYIGIDLDRQPEISINIWHILPTQRIIDLILGMDKAISKPNPMIKITPEKMRELK